MDQNFHLVYCICGGGGGGGGVKRCLNQTGVVSVIGLGETPGSVSQFPLKDPIICFLNYRAHTKVLLELTAIPTKREILFVSFFFIKLWLIYNIVLVSGV